MNAEVREFIKLARILRKLGATEVTFGSCSVRFPSAPQAKTGPVLVALPHAPTPPTPEPKTPQEIRAAVTKVLLDE